MEGEGVQDRRDEGERRDLCGGALNSRDVYTESRGNGDMGF